MELLDGGYVDEQTGELFALMDEDDSTSTVATPMDETARSDCETPPSGGSIGTGFHVNVASTLVTNAHRVSACASIAVDIAPEEIIAREKACGLAVLSAKYALEREKWLAFSDAPAR